MELSSLPLKLPLSAPILTLSCILLGLVTFYAIRKSKKDTKADRRTQEVDPNIECCEEVSIKVKGKIGKGIPKRFKKKVKEENFDVTKQPMEQVNHEQQSFVSSHQLRGEEISDDCINKIDIEKVEAIQVVRYVLDLIIDETFQVSKLGNSEVSSGSVTTFEQENILHRDDLKIVPDPETYPILGCFNDDFTLGKDEFITCQALVPDFQKVVDNSRNEITNHEEFSKMPLTNEPEEQLKESPESKLDSEQALNQSIPEESWSQIKNLVCNQLQKNDFSTSLNDEPDEQLEECPEFKPDTEQAFNQNFSEESLRQTKNSVHSELPKNDFCSSSYNDLEKETSSNKRKKFLEENCFESETSMDNYKESSENIKSDNSTSSYFEMCIDSNIDSDQGSEEITSIDSLESKNVKDETSFENESIREKHDLKVLKLEDSISFPPIELNLSQNREEQNLVCEVENLEEQSFADQNSILVEISFDSEIKCNPDKNGNFILCPPGEKLDEGVKIEDLIQHEIQLLNIDSRNDNCETNTQDIFSNEDFSLDTSRHFTHSIEEVMDQEDKHEKLTSDSKIVEDSSPDLSEQLQPIESDMLTEKRDSNLMDEALVNTLITHCSGNEEMINNLDEAFKDDQVQLNSQVLVSRKSSCQSEISVEASYNLLEPNKDAFHKTRPEADGSEQFFEDQIDLLDKEIFLLNEKVERTQSIVEERQLQLLKEQSRIQLLTLEMQNQKLYWKAVLEAEVEVDFDILMGGQDAETIMEKMKSQQEETVRTLKKSILEKVKKLRSSEDSTQLLLEEISDTFDTLSNEKLDYEEEIEKCNFNLNKHHLEIDDKDAKVEQLAEENNRLEVVLKDKDDEIESLNKIIFDLTSHLEDLVENSDKYSMVKRHLLPD